MARKGLGPYSLGAPKAVAKQIKDPKSGSEVVTKERGEKNGIKGTWIHSDVTTPGEGGVGFGINKDPEPKKTMRQAYDDASKKGWVKPGESFEDYSVRAREEIAAKKGSTTRKSRFLADPIALSGKPMGPIHNFPEIKAEGIKPFAKGPAVIQAQRGTADDPNNTLRGLSGTRSSGGSSTTRAIITSADRVKNLAKGIQNVTQQVEEKYNPENVPDRVRKMGPQAVEGWQKKVEARREALTPQVKTAFKMRGFPNSAVGKKYKK